MRRMLSPLVSAFAACFGRKVKGALPLVVCVLAMFATGVRAAEPTTPEGLTASEWASIRAAYEAGRHAAYSDDASPGGFIARNPGQRWRTRFDGRGFATTPDAGGWSWGLDLVSYGRGDAQQEICGTASIINEGQRVSYVWSGSLTEWFVNDQRGFEHGYTLRDRPAGVNGASGGELVFVLGVRGDLRPRVSGNGRDVAFRDGDGNVVVNYDALKVFDADGVELPASFRVIERAGAPALMLTIDDADARYPITVDPTAQQAYLKARYDASSETDLFGCSIAIAGDTVVIGAYGEDSSAKGVNGNQADSSAPDSGAAYVFVRSAGVWSQQAYLKASNTGSGDRFGWSVGIAGDTVVIGAPNEDSSALGVNGNQTDNSARDSGAAYVFVRSGTTWSQQAYIKASQTGTRDVFGIAVGVSGDTVVVGAQHEDSTATGVNGNQINNSASDSGAAYVFVRLGTEWSQEAYLKASNTGFSDLFGCAVAISNDTVVIGARLEDSGSTGVNGDQGNNGANGSGAAYVFARDGGTWSQQAYLKASNAGQSDEFGDAVAIWGDTIVIGARYERSNATGVNGDQANNSRNGAGAAYVFVRGTDDATWTQQAYLKASFDRSFNLFGSAVGVWGDTVVIGAIGDGSDATGINGQHGYGASSSGAAHIFVRSDATWTHQAYVKASNTDAHDNFARSVAIWGDTVVIGAVGEDSNATGVNGDEADNTAPETGAAYFFTRAGTTWSQQAYVKVPLINTEPGDGFGAAVAMSGNTLVVGAPFEDSSAFFVNGNQLDNSAPDSGAAYVFVRSGSSWTQSAYLKATNSSSYSLFGASVAISGNTIVVGATGDDVRAVNAGAAYVFIPSGSTWTQQSLLRASNAGEDDHFGSSVGIAGNTIVIGASGESSSATGIDGDQGDNSAPASGAVYVFVRAEGETIWAQQAYIKASNTESNDVFGSSIALARDTLVVGACGEGSNATGVNGNEDDNNALGAGAAYVFARSGTTWTQQAYLKASNTDQGDQFGWSVGAFGDTVAVGALAEASNAVGVNGNQADNSAAQSGAAYVFARTPGSAAWDQRAYLKGASTEADDNFGYSVGVSDDLIVIGAPNEDSGVTGINGDQANNTADGSGAAYVFVYVNNTWIQQAYIKAFNSDADDMFGASVAISGEMVVVGAPGEASLHTGPGDVGGDNMAPRTGAAYVFEIAPCAPSPMVSSTTFACEDTHASLNVTPGGEGPFTYQWRRDTVPIDTTSNPSAATANLLLDNVTQADAVTYDCVVSNACANATSNAITLIVLGANDHYCLGCPPCAMDYDNDGGVTGGDIAAFFHDFEQGLPCADIDQDGGITGADLAYFILIFESGSC